MSRHEIPMYCLLLFFEVIKIINIGICKFSDDDEGNCFDLEKNIPIFSVYVHIYRDIIKSSHIHDVR